jgi:hypothetical protein
MATADYQSSNEIPVNKQQKDFTFTNSTSFFSSFSTSPVIKPPPNGANGAAVGVGSQVTRAAASASNNDHFPPSGSIIESVNGTPCKSMSFERIQKLLMNDNVDSFVVRNDKRSTGDSTVGGRDKLVLTVSHSTFVSGENNRAARRLDLDDQSKEGSSAKLLNERVADNSTHSGGDKSVLTSNESKQEMKMSSKKPSISSMATPQVARITRKNIGHHHDVLLKESDASTKGRDSPLFARRTETIKVEVEVEKENEDDDDDDETDIEAKDDDSIELEDEITLSPLSYLVSDGDAISSPMQREGEVKEEVKEEVHPQQEKKQTFDLKSMLLSPPINLQSDSTRKRLLSSSVPASEVPQTIPKEITKSRKDDGIPKNDLQSIFSPTHTDSIRALSAAPMYTAASPSSALPPHPLTSPATMQRAADKEGKEKNSNFDNESDHEISNKTKEGENIQAPQGKQHFGYQ